MLPQDSKLGDFPKVGQSWTILRLASNHFGEVDDYKIYKQLHTKNNVVVADKVHFSKPQHLNI
jgi:hypothetical protein